MKNRLLSLSFSFLLVAGCSGSPSVPDGSTGTGKDSGGTNTGDGGGTGDKDAGGTGNADSGGTGNTDGGSGNKDSGVSVGDDGSVLAGADLLMVAKPDMATVNNGTSLMAGSTQLIGITKGNLVVALDENGDVFALPAAGGAKIAVATAPDLAAVSNDVVFVWTNVDQNSGIGNLAAWTQAGGLKTLVSGAYAQAGFAIATDDDKQVMYFADANGDVTTIGVYLANVDGSNPKEVISGAQFTNDCLPEAIFVAGGKLVVAYCPGTSDDTMSNILVAADVTTHAVATLATGAQYFFSVTKAGDKVMSVDVNGVLSVLPIAGGVGGGVVIDGNVSTGILFDDGSAVAYQTSDGALKRAALPATLPMGTQPADGGVVPSLDGGVVALGDGGVISSPGITPVTLVATGVNLIAGVSFDFKWVVYSTNFDSTLEYGIDLYLVPTDAPATPVTISSVTTTNIGYPFAGDEFSADSSQVLYYRNTTDEPIGDFTTWGVAAGSTAVNRGMDGMRSVSAHALTGAKVLYTANQKGSAFPDGTADLLLVDTSGTAAGKLVSSKADESFLFTQNKDTLIYTTSTGTGDGIYTYKIQ